MVEGRSSGSRINLVFAPSHLIKTKQWYLQISSPTTAAGPLPVYTGFPVKPFWAPWSNQIQNIMVAVNRKFWSYVVIHLYDDELFWFPYHFQSPFSFHLAIYML
jgi:hypothetical protein